MLVLMIWKVIDFFSGRMASQTELPVNVLFIANRAYLDDSLPAHTLDVYCPAEGSGHPVVVYIHGGGFVAGDKLQVRPFCVQLAAAGCSVFAINYRLAPRDVFPAQIQDVLAAVSWVCKNSSSFGEDPRSIFIAGDSAGAYLASYAACLVVNNKLAASVGLQQEIPGDLYLRGILLLSGLFDIKTAMKRKFLGIKADLEMFMGTAPQPLPSGSYSVPENLTSHFPPVFISSGETDGLHPESLQLIDALQQHGIPVTSLLFGLSEKQAFHCYHQHQKLTTSQKCLETAKSFIFRYHNRGMIE